MWIFALLIVNTQPNLLVRHHYLLFIAQLEFLNPYHHSPCPSVLKFLTTSGTYSLSSSISLGYDEALRHACSLQ